VQAVQVAGAGPSISLWQKEEKDERRTGLSASFPTPARLLIFLILTAWRILEQVASKLPSVVPTSKCAA